MYRYVEALTLVSRSGRLDAAVRREMESNGCSVNVVAADVRNANAMDVLLLSSSPGSIVWAAGVTGHAPLAEMSDAECWEVLAPKVAASHVKQCAGGGRFKSNAAC